MSRVNPRASAGVAAGDGFLISMNPLAKIAAPVPAMVILAFTRDVWTPTAFLVLAMAIALSGSRLSARATIGVALGLPLAVLALSVALGLWVDPSGIADSRAVFRIGGFTFTIGAWLVGLATAARMGALVALALIPGLSTTGPDLARSLVRQLGVPYRIGYAALAAFRFVPRFRDELDVIRAAHRVRGMAGGRGPWAWVRRRMGYAVPLLASAIRHADRVAMAMDARAFGAAPTRTERADARVRTRDVVFVLTFWALTVALFALVPGTRFGWL